MISSNNTLITELIRFTLITAGHSIQIDTVESSGWRVSGRLSSSDGIIADEVAK